MALTITSDCIVCNACISECPDNAIYEPGTEWAMADGTSLQGPFTMQNGTTTAAGSIHSPISNDYYYIVPDKCTECQGFHEEPQCAAVCPVDCCVPDEMYQETVAALLEKKEKLHA
ncbi:4Fe-4S dicluster domain-containing protein [Chitinophaga sp. Hz27]|uniref:4Fe-4S dicluster domain-containing protein n=1 Tax=Chitinophaga sp. Hz27 TaxID=3347169 RepID=UPI0035E02F34